MHMTIRAGELVAHAVDAHAGELIDRALASRRTRIFFVFGDMVVDDPHGMVVLRSLIGGERMVIMISGEQLPRIRWVQNAPE